MHNLYAAEENILVFNNVNSFGSFDDSTFNEIQGLTQEFFVHDTLEKLIVLTMLSILAVISHYRFRRLRKPILIASVAISGFYLGGFLCPITAVQNLFLRYNTAYVLMFMIPVLLSLLWGRLFCGYVCPFGSTQEVLRNKKWHLKIPKTIGKFLGKIKYILLIGLVVQIVITGELIGAGLTPFKALFQLRGTSIAITITLITAILSIIIRRPFCRFFCPLGAFLILVGRIRRILSYEVIKKIPLSRD